MIFLVIAKGAGLPPLTRVLRTYTIPDGDVQKEEEARVHAEKFAAELRERHGPHCNGKCGPLFESHVIESAAEVKRVVV